MDRLHRLRWTFAAALGATVIALAGCAAILSTKRVDVFLSGAEQVPPVITGATGNGILIVEENLGVSGYVIVSGMAPVAAHIHTGARGSNGGIAIGLVKVADNKWEVPTGAKFSSAQYQAFLAGETYVNVHSAAHRGGEIRAQLRP